MVGVGRCPCRAGEPAPSTCGELLEADPTTLLASPRDRPSPTASTSQARTADPPTRVRSEVTGLVRASFRSTGRTAVLRRNRCSSNVGRDLVDAGVAGLTRRRPEVADAEILSGSRAGRSRGRTAAAGRRPSSFPSRRTQVVDDCVDGSARAEDEVARTTADTRKLCTTARGLGRHRESGTPDRSDPPDPFAALARDQRNEGGVSRVGSTAKRCA
jgi:hypothetical protein